MFSNKAKFGNRSTLPVIMQIRFNCLLVLLVLLSVTLNAATIKGKVVINESWEPVVYLSLINSFDDLNTASYDLLIHRAEIDSLGNFDMAGMIIPEGNRLYRLHICKKGDPVSTIIIGGKDENFVHFVMDGNSDIQVVADGMRNGIQHSTINGNEANHSMEYLMALQKELQTPPSLPSKQNREIIKDQVYKKYHDIADTSSYAIIKLMAAYLILESTEVPDLVLMEKMENELKESDTSSPYYLAFADRIDYLKFQSEKSEFTNPPWIKLVGAFALLIFIGLAFWMRVRKYLKAKVKPNKELLSTLSIQEKKVFELLKNGASNKEISAELNIEVSTVKSHVHKVYSRLGVKSRKEIVNKDWE